MNGNTPYSGLPTETPAGRPTIDRTGLSKEQKRLLRHEVSQIAARVRMYLPEEYLVDSDVRYGIYGVEATVAVHPPIGNPVSAGFTPDPEEEPIIDTEEREEVAKGLAANAALQVKQAVQNDVTPTAQ